MVDQDLSKVPFCVDLDGTLIKTDTLHEMVLLLAKKEPATLLRLPAWLAVGRSNLKHRIANRIDFDPSSMPYRGEVMDLIHAARKDGRPIILVTAAPQPVAQAIAKHLGVFDDVMSSGAVNLAKHQKAEALVARFGEGGFDYVGNHSADLPVFEKSRAATLVSSSAGLRKIAARHRPDIDFLDAPTGGARAWVKALRVHQWLKNGLVFVPLIAAHQFQNPALLLQTILAFIAFNLCASSVYVLNDLLDLAADRKHRSKSRRPFAAGTLPISTGIILSPTLCVGAIAIAMTLPPLFLFVMIVYLTTTTLYSFFLKQQVVVDVFLLSTLYTLRILAGAAAAMISPSFWLLAFSMFIFFSLALIKRYSELQLSIVHEKDLIGRGYQAGDLPIVLTLGGASGLVSVLILAMYMQSAIVSANYPAQEWLWLVPPLILYWVARIWIKAGRGEIDDDPVVFAAKDWQSLLIAAFIAVLVTFASIGWSFVGKF